MTNSYYKWWKRGRFCHLHHLRILKQVMKWLVRFLYPSTDIPFDTAMGENVMFPHRAIGVVIHGDATIGDNTKILSNVCIGGRYMKGVPKIGKNVLVGTGTIIIGGISVGDDVIIGAGSVVTHDIPARKVVVGNPAKIIKDVPIELIGKPKI